MVNFAPIISCEHTPNANEIIAPVRESAPNTAELLLIPPTFNFAQIFISPEDASFSVKVLQMRDATVKYDDEDIERVRR